MYYELNIAILDTSIGQGQYKHYFATAPRSISTKDKLKEVYFKLKTTFPEPMYNITITKWESKGENIDVSKF